VVVDCLRGRKVGNHGAPAPLQGEQRRQRQSIVFADRASLAVDDRQPVGVGVLGKSGVCPFSEHTLAQLHQALWNRLRITWENAIRLSVQLDNMTAQPSQELRGRETSRPVTTIDNYSQAGPAHERSIKIVPQLLDRLRKRLCVLAHLSDFVRRHNREIALVINVQQLFSLMRVQEEPPGADEFERIPFHGVMACRDCDRSLRTH